MAKRNSFREPHLHAKAILAIERRLQSAARRAPDLLKPEYRRRVEAGADPLTGHCYVVSEAARALLGQSWKPNSVQHEGGVHWFLRGPCGGIFDATRSQFRSPVPYDEGRGRGFLTRDPSKRARELLRRAGYEVS